MMLKNKYLYIIVPLLLVFVGITYVILLPLHYNNEIKELYKTKKNKFNNIIELHKSHYPIYVYFHNSKSIDIRIRKPDSEFDTYIDLYDISLNDLRVQEALRKVNLSDVYLEELYKRLQEINCVSIGLLSDVSMKKGGAVEIGLYRNFIFGFWKYVFFENKIDRTYLRKYTTLSDNFRIIDDKVGWDIFH